jgi:hypothetical protein
MSAKIYKIQSLLIPEYIYINVTTKKYLSQRLTFYKTEYKKYQNSKLDVNEYKKYIAIKTEFGNEAIIKLFKLFDKYGIKNFHIILCNEINHKSLDDMKSQLFEYIKNNTCINKNI